VVFAFTHVSWWDGLLLMPLDDELGRAGRALMDANNLAGVPYLGPLGVVPLDRTSPQRMRAGLRAAVAFLSGPGRAMYVFPQGRQRPHHLRPLGLSRGANWLAEQSGAQLVPVALGYGFREAHVPAAVVSFGAPVQASSLEEPLLVELAAVDRFLDDGSGGFEPLVPPRNRRTDESLPGRILGAATRMVLGPPKLLGPPGRAVVVGAGLGGLSAAIRLAARGFRVEVIEAAGGPGGKAGTAVVDGVTFDTGPSVLTLPDVFDATFRDAGTRLADELELVAPSPAFRYRWPGGPLLDVFVDPDETLASVEQTLGRAARDELASFLAYARRIWEAAAPRFVYGPAPRPMSMLSLSALADLSAIDPLRTMAGAISAKVRDPHVRAVLLRYATYNGSDPRKAPATLNCIAHVELALGGYGVKGGIRAVVEALTRAAERLGVRFRYDERVERIEVVGGLVKGVRTARGSVPADVVVSNAEAVHTLADLVGNRTAPAPTSTSGWTAVARASVLPDLPRVAHEVSFPADYDEEFADLFDRKRVPIEPTVYSCAQSVAHASAGWPGHEPLFVMVNAPVDHDREDWDALEGLVRRRLVDDGRLGAADAFVWRRTPAELAARFPGSRGALYGAASNGWLSAFRRPPNRVPGIKNLFLASGSAHPGGGMPLCVLSGRAAAEAASSEVT
jgi:phytoene desaturase